MRYALSITLLILLSFTVYAGNKDSTVHYPLPDSVKAVSFLADIKIQSITGKKEVFAGIKTDMVQLVLEADKKQKEISFEFPKSATILATGIDVKKEKGELEWKYDWAVNETYKLLLAIANDSAGNFRGRIQCAAVRCLDGLGHGFAVN